MPKDYNCILMTYYYHFEIYFHNYDKDKTTANFEILNSLIEFKLKIGKNFSSIMQEMLHFFLFQSL